MWVCVVVILPGEGGFVVFSGCLELAKESDRDALQEQKSVACYWRCRQRRVWLSQCPYSSRNVEDALGVIVERCYGLDVHKASVTARFQCNDESEVRTFATTTEALLEMSDL